MKEKVKEFYEKYVKANKTGVACGAGAIVIATAAIAVVIIGKDKNK